MMTKEECISGLHEVLDSIRPLLASYAKTMIENNDLNNRYDVTILDGVRTDDLQWLLYEVIEYLGGSRHG